MLKDGARIGTMAKQIPWLLPLLKSLPQSWIAAMDPGMKLYFSFVNGCAEQIKAIILKREEMEDIVKQKMSTQPTLFHEILDASIPPAEKTPERLGQELHTVVTAGTETTANTMSVITYHLLENPDKLQRLRDEIQQLEPNNSAEIKIQKLEQLPYLVFVPSLIGKRHH
jgi:cytochrome P450